MHDYIATPEEIAEGLDIARRLIAAGVPVFVAKPCAGAACRRQGHTERTEYDLPKDWQKTVPTERWLDRYQPGDALAAVGGSVADFVDVDPRNGGQESWEEIVRAGHRPRIFGTASTKSGGHHYVISLTGERKDTGFMPGVDLQAGAPDGQGRGFVYIAPTVARSKDPADGGARRPYRWIEPPDLELLAEFAGSDDSVEGIVTRVRARQEARTASPRESALAAAVDDPFMTASVAGAVGGTVGRTFTMAQAQDFVRPSLVRLQAAQVGSIEEMANAAAAQLSHFIPSHWTVEQGMSLLTAALAHTQYDPDGPSDWTVEKFRPVLDGRRPVADPWRALAVVEPAVAMTPVVEAAPGQEAMSVLDRLRSMLVSAEDLAELPSPEPLVHGLLNLDSLSWIIGAPGSFKSFVVLDLAAHVGSGRDWQGHRVERAGVLYIAAEGARGMTLRTRAWRKRHGAMEGVTFLPYPVQVKSGDGQWEALVQIARELRPGLIVVDTQHRVSTALEENSATDMGLVVAAVDALRRATGACVLTVHHTGRNGSDARGSSAIDGAQDTELKVLRDSDRGSLRCKVVQDKQKDMAEGTRDGVPLVLEVVDLGEDPRSGRVLTSLVVAGADAFRAAEGITVTEEGPEPWELLHGEVQARVLKVMRALGGTVGLTKAEVRTAVAERWYEGKVGKAEGALKHNTFTYAWKGVLEKHAPTGDPIVSAAGARFVVDEVAFAALNVAMAAAAAVGQEG